MTAGMKSWTFKDEVDHKRQAGNRAASKRARKDCKILRRVIKHSEKNKVRQEISDQKKTNELQCN